MKAEIPKTSAWLCRWFTWYARGYLKRHFHSLRVSLSGGAPPDEGVPLVIYCNHASWWDPLVCAVLADAFFPERTAFAPIDAVALEKYKFFRKLGFFPVEQGSRQGAVQFLRTAKAVLRERNHALWLTPQGRFADIRERPLQFRAGLGHLPQRIERASFVPLAIEYGFWEEKQPEILVRFGEQIRVSRIQAVSLDAKGWTARFEERLQKTQDALAYEALRREPADFECLLRGRAGVGGVYDWWRRLNARVRGEAFSLEHGSK